MLPAAQTEASAHSVAGTARTWDTADTARFRCMVDIGHTAIDGPGAVPETLATVATVESQAPIEPEALVSPWAPLQTAPWEPHCPTLQDVGSIARRTPNTGYRQGVWRSRNA